MKELNRKVFVTLFLILSLIIISLVMVYNAQLYRKEYDNVFRNLTFIGDKNIFKPKDNKFEPKENSEAPVSNPRDRELDNMMIMDYEVYTVKLNDGSIEKINNHSDEESDFDIESIANKILDGEDGLHIGNLFNNKYSYNYFGDTIVVVNTKKINDKMILTLIKSIGLLVLLEVIVYIVCNVLTKRITKPAEEAFNKQKDFIADASHELKTPLAVIMASADELKSDKKNEKYVGNIKYETDRMSTLIKGLLDLSKLENGVSIESYKDENLSKIIERISLTFEGIAFEKNVTIDTNIEDNIMFKCSKAEMERLISIILDNAIKHSYKDSRIEINAVKDRNNICIEITNCGDPIKDGDEEKIFERFYRADKSRNRDANRYGLGLAIAKNITINHNGSIKAFSCDGKTTFKILLKK